MSNEGIYVLQRRDTGELYRRELPHWTTQIEKAARLEWPEDVANLIDKLETSGYNRANLVGKVITVIDMREADNG